MITPRVLTAYAIGSRNMSEAIIVEAKRDLESYLENYGGNYEWAIYEVINELSMMLDFMRDKESGERSRLKYLLADFVEMALNCADFTRLDPYDFYQNEIRSDLYFQELPGMLDILRSIKKRMMEFEVGEAPQSSFGGEEEEEGAVVVGLEKDVKQLVERAIFVEKTDLVSVAIKGMVGVGKTTLAKQVYNHAAIAAKFKWRAWVSLSSGTSVNEMLVEVIKQLVGIDGDSLLEEMDNRSLRKMLRHHMQGMPYFIVIDNLLPQISVQYFTKDLINEGMSVFLLSLNYL